jgi:hypothetical protein
MNCKGTVSTRIDNSTGYSVVSAGSSGKPGYIGFHKPGGSRAGYIGWHEDNTSTYLNMWCDDYNGYRINKNLLVYDFKSKSLFKLAS